MPCSPPSRRPSPSRRRIALLRLWLALALAAGPWWQQAWAMGGAQDIPAMAICSVGSGASGGAPAHLAPHCHLCCGNQAPHAPPTIGAPGAAAIGISYPLAAALRAHEPVRTARVSPQARAPPA